MADTMTPRQVLAHRMLWRVGPHQDSDDDLEERTQKRRRWKYKTPEIVDEYPQMKPETLRRIHELEEVLRKNGPMRKFQAAHAMGITGGALSDLLKTTSAGDMLLWDEGGWIGLLEDRYE